MGDFNLSDALDCCSNEEFPHSDVMERQSEEFKLDLKVSTDRRTMRKVANLILVVNKMRKTLSAGDGSLSDDELRSFIMDQVMDETVFESNWSTAMEERKVIYERANSSNECDVTDVSQKNLTVYQGMQCNLQAITLRAGYDHLKVNFTMSRYIPSSEATAVDGICVLLSIKDKNLHLSCSWEDDRAVLNLEECNDEKLKNICQGTDMDRFLFIKKTTGYSLTTFESVKYRNWFISTSSDDRNRSVEMCTENTSQRNCTFKVNKHGRS